MKNYINKKNLRDKLSDLSYEVTQNSGTEPPFSGKYVYNKLNGTYHCICCNAELFKSNDKFDSGSGWPSFTESTNDDCILHSEDNSYNMQRVEVRCKKCNSHLGHVFNDGPKPSGKRFCINSVALKFKKNK